MSRCAITAVGVGRFGKRPEPLDELLAEAGRIALEGIGRKSIDLLVIGNMAGGTLAGTENLTGRLLDRLALEAAGGLRVEAASASGAAALHAGFWAVQSGRARRALIVAGEKMTGLSTPEVSRVLAHSLAPSEIAAGATMPALASLVAQLYLEKSGVAEEAMAEVTVQARAAAARNPNAQFPTPVTVGEVTRSRPIAPPLRLLHCSAITDGAAAVVLERSEGSAAVVGLGQGSDALALCDRTELSGFRATRRAAQQAFEMSRLTRKEISFAELHDAFAPFAFLDLEDIGECGPGEAPHWFTSGWTRPDGRFPVNPSGGILGRGHPVGASGLVQVAEAARQLLGEAAGAQLPRVRYALTQSIGGLASHNFVTILGPNHEGAS